MSQISYINTTRVLADLEALSKLDLPLCRVIYSKLTEIDPDHTLIEAEMFNGDKYTFNLDQLYPFNSPEIYLNEEKIPIKDWSPGLSFVRIVMATQDKKNILG